MVSRERRQGPRRLFGRRRFLGPPPSSHGSSPRSTAPDSLVAHFNHRSARSADADERFVIRMAQKLGLPLYRAERRYQCLCPPARPEHRGGGRRDATNFLRKRPRRVGATNIATGTHPQRPGRDISYAAPPRQRTHAAWPESLPYRRHDNPAADRDLAPGGRSLLPGRKTPYPRRTKRTATCATCATGSAGGWSLISSGTLSPACGQARPALASIFRDEERP